jgi:pimeloyl-ACP methyl ester carboxylesterase
VRLETVGIAADGVTLAALRYLPDRSPRPTALLFSHGFTAGKYSLDGLAGYLAGRGYEGLTFDFVGHKLGATGGEMWRAEQAVDNLSAALGWLRRHSAARNVVLIGHSMGAVATLGLAAREAMAHKEPEGSALAGLACLCTGLEPTRGFEGAIGQAMLTQRSDYVVGAPALQLLTELNTLVLTAQEVGAVPTLFIAARQDVLISTAQVEALAALVGPTAKVQQIESSHLEAPDRARTVIAQWLEKILRTEVLG